MTKLNLLLQLQQQKLLAENKERAGFNRSAKEDRSRTTKTADKASNPPATSPAAQAQQAEDARKKKELSGGSLNLHKRRRPAATGSDDATYRVFGLSNLAPYDWPEKIAAVSIPWTATFDRRVQAGSTVNVIRVSAQRTNSYSVAEREWMVGFNEDLGDSVQLITTPKHTLPGVITNFDWYFHQSSDGYPGEENFVNRVEKIIASPPLLTPHNSSFFTNKQTVSPAGYSLSSSDGRYIYHSTYYSTGTPRPAFFETSPFIIRNIFTAEPIYADYYNLDYIDFDGLRYYGQKIHRVTSDIRYLQSLNYSSDDRYFGEATGLYWRYDTETEGAVPELRVTTLSYPGDGTAGDQRNVLSNFLDNLNTSDPYREWWKFRYGNLHYNSFAFLSSVTPKIDSYLRWPQNLVYYKDTGLAIFTKALKINNVAPASPTVYSIETTPNMPIYTVMQTFPYLTDELTSHETMLSSGWSSEDVDTSSSVLLDPAFRVTHRTQ